MGGKLWSLCTRDLNYYYTPLKFDKEFCPWKMVLGGLRSSYWVSVAFSRLCFFASRELPTLWLDSHSQFRCLVNNVWINPLLIWKTNAPVHSFIEGLSHIHLWEFHHRQIYKKSTISNTRRVEFIERTPVALPASWYHKKETMCIYYIHTLPETNVAPTTRPSQKEK